MSSIPDATIYITLGRDRKVGLNIRNELVFRNGGEHLSLGVVTKKGIDHLCEYLQDLRKHCTEE